jgi:tetratricopeptide (TPR) repeat protein
MSTEEQLSQIKGVDSLKNFYDTNKKNINIAAIAAILVMAGVWYYVREYKPAVEVDANNSFFMAERYYQMDSFNYALNGDGINPGMLDIADEFGSTKVGDLALYYAGRIYLNQGKYNEAIDYLSDASLSDEIMNAQVITLIGDCYSELGDFSKAGDKYMKAANARDNELTTPYALKKAGEAYEEAGEFSDALTALNKLKDDFPTARESQSVDARIARVEAKKAAK